MKYIIEDGYLHQVNGPAMEWEDGGYSWWYNGKRHRYYGIAWGCDFNSYWIFGKKVL